LIIEEVENMVDFDHDKFGGIYVLLSSANVVGMVLAKK
tara:strand:- start:294 stop:407 length:114 start_codon:yes stop_codon:yes gene_type:complete